MLRAEPTIRRVEYVKYPDGNEYWIALQEGRRLDMTRIEAVVRKNGFRLARFGSLPSKLPKGLSELVWNGVTHVILKDFAGMDKLKGFLGFEPEGIARIAEWGHGPYQLYASRTWEGLKILFEYLGLEMPEPPPPPAPPTPTTAPAKPQVAPRPVAPAAAPKPAPQSSAARPAQASGTTPQLQASMVQPAQTGTPPSTPKSEEKKA